MNNVNHGTIGVCPLEGQLLPEERRYLHSVIRGLQPAVVFEIGMWKGGGSTWQILQALMENGSGVLYTCEPNAECCARAKEFYARNTQIMILQMTGLQAIDWLASRGVYADVVFCDGEENPDTALDEFCHLGKIIKPRSRILFHDWNPPSVKNVKVRPVIEGMQNFDLITYLTEPVSVGIVDYVMKYAVDSSMNID